MLGFTSAWLLLAGLHCARVLGSPASGSWTVELWPNPVTHEAGWWRYETANGWHADWPVVLIEVLPDGRSDTESGPGVLSWERAPVGRVTWWPGAVDCREPRTRLRFLVIRRNGYQEGVGW